MMNEKEIKALQTQLEETQQKRVTDVDQLKKVIDEANAKIKRIKEEFDFTRGQIDILAGVVQVPAPESKPLDIEPKKETKKDTSKEE